MAFMNSHKTFAVKSELDLFATKPTQNSVESGVFVESRPISVLDSESPLEFFVCSSDEYIDLPHTQIKLKVKITKEDGKDIDENDSVAPCNNFLNSLFEHVSVDLNNKTITPPSNFYNYRTYFENLINYGNEAKKTHLGAQIFIADEAEKFDNITSKGFVDRRKLINDNGEVEMSGYIHSELFSVDKYLINGVSMRLKFYRCKNNFSLMTGEGDMKNYKVKILEAMLLVRKVKINPSIVIAHAKALTRANIKYPINLVLLKTVSLGSNLQSRMIDNIFIGQLPKRVYCAFVSSAAMNGNWKKNPYNFQHFNFTNILLTSDTHTQIRPIQCDFSKGHYLDAYMSLFSSAGIHFSDTGNGIDRKMYPHGFVVVGFDLSEDYCASSNHWSIPRQGSLRLDIKFSEPLKENVNLIVYSEFDNLIEIDSDRNIYLDYAS